MHIRNSTPSGRIQPWGPLAWHGDVALAVGRMEGSSFKQVHVL